MCNLKKILSLLVILVTTCTMLAACGDSSVSVTESEQPTTPETVSVAQDTETAAASVEEVEFTFIVDSSDLDGGSVTETKAKAKGSLGDYVRTLDYCVWEDGPYGLFVHSFYDFENDDASGYYWSFYVDDEYAMVGADEIPLEEGKTYTWKLECFS